MKRWKLYFAYSHLPPHLQAVSRPFHDAVKAIVDARYKPDRAAMRDLFDGCALAFDGVVDEEEAGFGRGWLASAIEDVGDDACGTPTIRDLIRAKDCAVRAHLPDPPEPDAG